MDPKATFVRWCDAVRDGDYDEAGELESIYFEWIAKGGFAADDDGDSVWSLDTEQDRYGVGCGGVEKWRAVR